MGLEPMNYGFANRSFGRSGTSSSRFMYQQSQNIGRVAAALAPYVLCRQLS
jgi:hypothetical protein